MRTKEEILEELEEAENNLKDLEDRNKKDEYDEWLDDLHEPYKVGCCEFSASQVLSELDPIAYDCGYYDFVESERYYYEEQISDLKSELEELEE